MSDLQARLAKAEAKLEQILESRQQVAAALQQIGLCKNLEHLIADPDFPFEYVAWWTPLGLTPEQFGRALPYLIELQKLLRLRE